MTTRRNLTPIAYTQNRRNPYLADQSKRGFQDFKLPTKAIGIYQKTKLLSISVWQCHNLHKEEEGGNVK